MPNGPNRDSRGSSKRIRSERPGPALDLYTTPEAIVAKVALPGVKPENVDITIGDDLVTISGSFKEEKETTEAGFVHEELSHGSFSRSFSIPTSEAVTASFKNGPLTLTLPKTEEVKPKHVKVDVSGCLDGFDGATQAGRRSRPRAARCPPSRSRAARSPI